MKTEDPWSQMKPPTSVGALTARRVDADIRWNFFWAVDSEARVMLVLLHEPASSPNPPRYPVLRGMEVKDEKAPEGPMLVFRLLDPEHREIFARLCADIVDRAGPSASEREAVAVAIHRTWRWHYLLRGGRDGRLSVEEQKGLIGELVVLDRFLVGHLPAGEAVAAWRGPQDATQDFAFGEVRIESKAARGRHDVHVLVSSEYQLETPEDASCLFLHVTNLVRPDADDGNGSTLTEYAMDLKERIERESAAASDQYDAMLAAAGFVWEHDYSEWLWADQGTHIYEVGPEFPRIVASSLSVGVHGVRYSLDLGDCAPFSVTPEVLQDAISSEGAA